MNQNPNPNSPQINRVYRSGLPERPGRMLHLPLDERGYPVPWFVAFIDGKPDFRVIRRGGVAEAWNKKLCWLCGHPMGVFKACVVGPMCGINRVTAEPPSHLECAEYSIKACPFLTRPLAVRNERTPLPEDGFVPGIGIPRNPGVVLLWVTKTIKPFKAHGGGGGVLFRLSPAVSWSFWREGRRATRTEIEESITTGLPILREQAEKQGPMAVAEIERQLQVFQTMLPLPLSKG